MSNRTKLALSAALSKQLETKNIDKITINDITTECHINRMTFYYHFKDIYDLANWMFKREYLSLLTHTNEENWFDNLNHLFVYSKEHRKAMLNILNSRYGNRIEGYLLNINEKVFCDLLSTLVKGRNIDEDTVEFISKYHATALTGLFLQWLKSGDDEQPDYILSKLKIMLPCSLDAVLKSIESA